MRERERRVIYIYRKMYTLLSDIELKKVHCVFGKKKKKKKSTL